MGKCEAACWIQFGGSISIGSSYIGICILCHEAGNVVLYLVASLVFLPLYWAFIHYTNLWRKRIER